MGGSFDPFHVGHLALARAAVDALGLDRLLVIPAAAPPHKLGRAMSPPEIRLEMVEAGIAGERGLEASRIELDRSGPSYTVDTVAALLAQVDPGDQPVEIVVVLSTESFAGLATWHEPDRLLGLARIAVAPRAGHPAPDLTAFAEAFPGRADRVVVIPGPEVDVSASDIRRRVARGDSIEGLVPPGVIGVIDAHRLYRQPQLMEDASPVTEPLTDETRPTRSGSAAAATPRSDGLPTRGAAGAAVSEPASERAPLDMARRIVELAEDKKAADIVLLDLQGLTTVADAFVICSGGSERQLEAIADGIIEGMRAEKVRPIGREGTSDSHWVLLDYGSVIVHVFTPPERDYYQLERHWSGARTVLRVQ